MMPIQEDFRLILFKIVFAVKSKVLLRILQLNSESGEWSQSKLNEGDGWHIAAVHQIPDALCRVKK